MSTDWIELIKDNTEKISYTEKKRLRSSSVLIPLIRGEDGETLLLFEQRAMDLDAQPGEICFPGGGVEDGETPEAAAVRETCEELLVDPGQIEMLCDVGGISRHAITNLRAYVGIVRDYKGTYSKNEVDHVFTVPLSWFIENPPEGYGAVLTTIPDDDFPFDLIPGGRNYPWMKRRNDIFFYRYGDEVIWGLTARIVWTFVGKVKGLDL